MELGAQLRPPRAIAAASAHSDTERSEIGATLDHERSPAAPEVDAVPD
jgi:hypothetical protein